MIVKLSKIPFEMYHSVDRKCDQKAQYRKTRKPKMMFFFP